MKAFLVPILLCCAGGMAYSQTGYSWSPQTSGTTGTLQAVHLLDNTHGAAVGNNGTVLFFNGTSWTQQDVSAAGFLTGAQFQAVRMLGPDQVLVGSLTKNNSGVTFWDGASWSPWINAGPNGDQISSLWNLAGTNLVFSGRSGGRITLYNDEVATVGDNSKWSRKLNESGSRINSFHAVDSSLIWAVGSGGRIYQSTNQGGDWLLITDPQINEISTNWNGIYSFAADQVWAVGSGGQIAHWNGSLWDVRTFSHEGNVVDLNAIGGIDASHLWAVGNDGAILFYDGNAWASVSTGLEIADDLHSISITTAGHLWVVGENGSIFHAAPIPEPSAAALALLGLTGLLAWKSRLP
ncbi:MAG TPA: hypothetical protein VNQ90_13595 [Chthoniobacteraceae bacterium]|nr:hypothetical protein [Chthoniobacteraceae bacterium]